MSILPGSQGRSVRPPSQQVARVPGSGLADAPRLLDIPSRQRDAASGGKLDDEHQQGEQRGLPVRPVLARVLGAAADQVEQPPSPNLVGAHPTDVVDGYVRQEEARVTELTRPV